MKKSMFTILSLVMVLSMTLTSTAFAATGSTTGSSAPGTWASSINIQNTGTSDATVDLLFYDGTGALVIDYKVDPVIPAGGSRSLYIPTALSSIAGGQYSVVAQSTSPLQIVANASSTVPYTAGAYNGLQMSDVGTSLYFPGLYNGYYGFSSEMALQNTTATVANVTIKFYDQKTGTYLTGKDTTDTIPANGTKIYSLASLTGIPTGNTAGLLSAQVTSDQALGGVGNIWTSAIHGEFGDYDGVVSGSTAAVYVPALYNSYYNFVSSLTVQNLGSAVAHAVITYGNGHVVNQDINANQAVQFYQPNDSALPSGNTNGVFSANVTSTNSQPLVAIVNVEDKTKGSFGSYNGTNTVPTKIVGCPVVMKAYFDWFTAETVQNVGTAATDITVTYASGQTKTFSAVPANGTINVVELASAGSVLPDGSSVSATFTSTTQPIVAVVQENSNARYSVHPGDYLLAYTCTAQ